MPFKSKKQRKFLYKNKPEIAKKFSKHKSSKKKQTSKKKSKSKKR